MQWHQWRFGLQSSTRGPSASSQALYHCAPIKKNNNLDPSQATMVVFPDTMYTLRDTKGVKIDNFFSYLTFVTAKYCMHWSRGGQGAQTSLEKHKLYGIL